MKKKLLTLTILVTLNFVNAQQQDSLKVFAPREYFKIYYCAPLAVGNNVLTKAHNPDYGFGFAFTFLQYYNFQLNGGFKYLKYRTSDPAFSTTASTLKLSGFYAEVLYIQHLSTKINVNPQILVSSLDMNIGGAAFSMKRSKGKQSGTTIGGGFDISYSISNNTKVYAGVVYTMSYMKTKTAPELEKFYNRLGQLNIMAGFKF